MQLAVESLTAAVHGSGPELVELADIHDITTARFATRGCQCHGSSYTEQVRLRLQRGLDTSPEEAGAAHL